MTPKFTNPEEMRRFSDFETTIQAKETCIQHMFPDDPQTLDLPRILCLHGGGTNSHIFRAQCRALVAHLKPFFRLVFAEAPFLSNPGPDVVSVYKEWGPFRSWIPMLQTTDTDDDDIARQVYQSLSIAMMQDDDAGATGSWVGLLGFSQGASLAVSLLLKQHLDETLSSGRRYINTNRNNRFRTNYKFAVLIAGRPPSTRLRLGVPETVRLQVPTIHVHGLKDPHVELHKTLISQCNFGASYSVIEWDGGHRLPIKTSDVDMVTAEVLRVAVMTSCI